MSSLQSAVCYQGMLPDDSAPDSEAGTPPVHLAHSRQTNSGVCIYGSAKRTRLLAVDLKRCSKARCTVSYSCLHGSKVSVLMDLIAMHTVALTQHPVSSGGRIVQPHEAQPMPVQYNCRIACKCFRNLAVANLR